MRGCIKAYKCSRCSPRFTNPVQSSFYKIPMEDPLNTYLYLLQTFFKYNINEVCKNTSNVDFCNEVNFDRIIIFVKVFSSPHYFTHIN